MTSAADTTHADALAARPAQAADIPELARLLAQLYAVELPGALRGPLDAQHALMRFTLEAQPAQALRERYVLADAAGHVVATGMLQRPTEPAFERAPAGTIGMAMKLLGPRAVGALLLTVARSLIGVYAQRRSDTVLLHSIVVDERQRGHGHGRAMLQTLEQAAAEHGYRYAALQVLARNSAARRMYLHAGYRDVWRTPRSMALLGWPSSVMQKTLPGLA